MLADATLPGGLPGASGTDSDAVAHAPALGAALRRCEVDWAAPRKDPAGWRALLADLQEVCAAAGAAGLLPLQDVCVLTEEQVRTLAAARGSLQPRDRDLVATWPRLVREYVESGAAAGAAAHLIDHLRDARWETPLGADDAEMLLSLLVPGISTPGHVPPAEGPEEAEASAPVADASAAADTGGFAEAVPSPAPAGAPVTASGDESVLADLPDSVRELLELLSAELQQMVEQLAETVAVAAREDAEPGERRDLLEQYGEQVERFGAAAEAVGFQALAVLCARTGANVVRLAAAGRPLAESEADALADWLAGVGEYLPAFAQPGPRQALVSLLSAPPWPEPLTGSEARELCAALAAPALECVAEPEEPRQTRATEADVALELPGDADPELLESLLQELPAQVSEFSAAVQKLIAGGSLADLEVAQRVAHTVKGAANTVGIAGLARLTHHLEDILVALAKEERLPPRAIAGMLTDASDCLEMMCEALLGQGPEPADAVHVLQQVLDWANRIDREGVPAADAGVSGAGGETPAPGSERSAAAAPAASGDAPPAVRVHAHLLDGLLRVVGESTILTGQVQERIRRIIDQTRAMREQFGMLQQLGAELEHLVDIRDLTGARRPGAAGSDFDPLELDQYNELHTCSRRLVEAATDARELGRMVEDQLAELGETMRAQSRLNRESQEAVLRTRMVSVHSVVPRLQRVVRQTCRFTGKEAELHVGGASTLMDGDVLHRMLDPLMHVLRNAVDHGVESPSERAARGKAPAGRIELEFAREGNYVAVRCRDDGAGLDLAAIREAGENTGFLRPGAAAEDSELTRLVLRPGFSTRSEASQTSGRGIGLDAVNTQVLALGGSVEIRSIRGEGCTLELRLPVSLISVHALLVRVHRHVFAVSGHGIAQIVYPGGGQLRAIGEERVWYMGDEVLTTRELETLLGMERDRRAEQRRPPAALLVHGENGLIAVLAEDVIDTRDLVVKSLGPYVPRLPGVIGATILGDGGVAAVLDLPELLRAERREGSVVRTPAPVQADSDRGLPRALVVDDSLSARRALEQVLTDTGYEVRAARDGLEALEALKGGVPDLLLVDLEMPRMNGLELAAHLRAQEATREVPVIMITSRFTDKHRRQAEAAGVDAYLTKPFNEDALLETIGSLRSGRA